MAFRTEADLFDTALESDFIRALFDPQVYIAHLVEPKGLFGIPDLVIANTASAPCGSPSGFKVFAFEMKLRKWKRALVQAYRYKAFADQSFVVIDAAHARPAVAHLDAFCRSNIGLLSIDEASSIEPHFMPRLDAPYSDQLETAVKNMILETTESQPFQPALIPSNDILPERPPSHQ